MILSNLMDEQYNLTDRNIWESVFDQNLIKREIILADLLFAVFQRDDIIDLE